METAQTPRAVALLSGGLDSAIAVAMALARNVGVELAVTYDYGQRAATQEIQAAEKISRHFGVPHKVLTLPWLKDVGSCGLFEGNNLPLLHENELDDVSKTLKSSEAVWVPNRNGVFIEIAASLAEGTGANAILVGFNAEEAQTFPDNSVSYLQAVNRALEFSTRGKIEVLSPTAMLTKAEIVKEALARRMPLELLWSCYDGGAQMCGLCESCLRLIRALKRNGVMSDAYFKQANA